MESKKHGVDFTGAVVKLNDDETTSQATASGYTEPISPISDHGRCAAGNESLQLGPDETTSQESGGDPIFDSGNSAGDIESQLVPGRRALRIKSELGPSDRAETCIGTVTVITNLEVYKGDSLEKRLDSLVAAHPVVMFNRTWCLFSVDAQSFLTVQLGVSIHCIEVDIHPQGKAILRHIQQKNDYGMVPVIFIKGEFLGGFEHVNALYASGKLQNQYLRGLSQADRCEEFIKKSTIGTQPLFWFPKTVNAHVVRGTGILTSVSAGLSAGLVHWYYWGRYLAYGIFLDFVLRFFGGSRFSVMGRLATLSARPWDPKPRHGRPKQFATVCGMMFSGLGSLSFLVTFPYHDFVGVGLMGGLAIASGMEGLLDFCVGCVIFKYGIKLGVIPK